VSHITSLTMYQTARDPRPARVRQRHESHVPDGQLCTGVRQSDDSPINTTLDHHESDKDMPHAPAVHSRQTKTHGTYLRLLRLLLFIAPIAYKNHTKPTALYPHPSTNRERLCTLLSIRSPVSSTILSLCLYRS